MQETGGSCDSCSCATVAPVIRVFSSSVTDSNEGNTGNLNTCIRLLVLETCTQEEKMDFRPLLVHSGTAGCGSRVLRNRDVTNTQMRFSLTLCQKTFLVFTD